MSGLEALAKRCEAAVGADREADVLIWAYTLGYTPQWQGNCLVVGIEGVVGWIDPGEHQRNFSCSRSERGPGSVPAYTASVDAAMKLVPAGDGRWPQLEYIGPNPNDARDGHRVTVWQQGMKPVRGHSAISFPLALTAAALRAHLATDGGKTDV